MANDVEHPMYLFTLFSESFSCFSPIFWFKKKCIYVHVRLSVSIWTRTSRFQRKPEGRGMPWSHLIRVLGTTPRSSGRAACAPNRAFSPAPHFLMLLIFPTEFSFRLDSSLLIDYVGCRCFLPVCNYTHFLVFCTKSFAKQRSLILTKYSLLMFPFMDHALWSSNSFLDLDSKRFFSPVS